MGRLRRSGRTIPSRRMYEQQIHNLRAELMYVQKTASQNLARQAVVIEMMTKVLAAWPHQIVSFFRRVLRLNDVPAGYLAEVQESAKQRPNLSRKKETEFVPWEEAMNQAKAERGGCVLCPPEVDTEPGLDDLVYQAADDLGFPDPRIRPLPTNTSNTRSSETPR